MTDDATPLDRAHAAMAAAPDDDALRLAFWGEVAGSLLHVALEGEGEGGVPLLFPLDGVAHVLAFDREERLATFAEAPVARAEMPGRAVAEWLAGQGGVGLALNLGAPSGVLLPPEGVAWLAATLARSGAAQGGAAPVEVGPPGPVLAGVAGALDRALARAAGLAAGAVLAGGRWADGRRGLVLGLVGAAPGAEDALARALSEAFTFAGAGDAAPALVFTASGSDLAARLARVGLRIDLPAPPAPAPAPAPAAPGSNPDAPPRLR